MFTSPLSNDVCNFMNEISSFFDLICFPNTEERYEYVEGQIKRKLSALNNEEIKVLDLCMGTGDMCIKLSKSGFDVTGIDYAEGMVNVAKSKNEKLNLNAKFQLGDIKDLNTSSKYDCIYGNSFIWIDNINDLEKVIQNISKILTSQGFFIIDIPNRENFLSTYKAFSAKCAKYLPKTYSKIVMYPEYPNRTNPLIQVIQTYLVHETDKHQHSCMSCDFQFRLYSLDELKIIAKKFGLKILSTDEDYGKKKYDQPKDYQIILVKESI